MGEENKTTPQVRFCTSCGAKLKESAAFCAKCGAKVGGSAVRQETGNTRSVKTEPVKTTSGSVNGNNVQKKKGKGPLTAVIIIISIIFVAIVVAGAFAVLNYETILEKFGFQQKNEHFIDDDDEDEDEKEDKKDTKESEDASSEEVASYESEDITDSTEGSFAEDAGPLKESDIDEEKLSMLFDIAAHDPEGMTRKKDNYQWSFFCYAAGYKDYIEKYYDLAPESESWMTVFSVEDAENFILNSIGSDDLSEIEDRYEGDYCYIKGGKLYAMTPDTGDSWDQTAVVIDHEITSDGKLKVTGYHEEGAFTESHHHILEAIFVKNPESIWSGLTLESIEELDDEHYLLPEAQYKNYTRDEVDFTPEMARYARNEIYARHGRRFKDQELQMYFDQQSWYEGTEDEVPETELNEYEKNNIKLMAEIEQEQNN